MKYLVSALALGLFLSGCAEPPALEGLAIENVTVVDGVDGIRENQRVVVTGDRIVAVAPMANPPLATARTIDGSGRFLIPGLWDMHVHFLYDEALTEVMAALFLDYGITSVRDTGGNIERLTALREQLRRASNPAPRVFVSGPLLDGRAVVYDGADPGQPPLGTSVPDVETARQKVRALHEAGADFIKIYELVDPDVFAALAAQARELGLPIASHVPLMTTADSAGPLADSMEHLRNIELACAADWQALLEIRRNRVASFVEGRGFDLRRELHTLQRLPAIADYSETRCNHVLDTLTGTIQVPTLRLNTLGMTRPFERADWPAALARLPVPVQGIWQARAEQISASAPVADHTFADWSTFLVSRLVARGVPVGAGTDTPIGLAIPGYSLHTELELLVQSGLSPLMALHAATVMPARFFGLEAEMGRIQPGMLADLVLLDGNPLENIANTRKISRVMINGEWYR
jgi:imidazolonepropionase-like amidohydrolase